MKHKSGSNNNYVYQECQPRLTLKAFRQNLGFFNGGQSIKSNNKKENGNVFIEITSKKR